MIHRQAEIEKWGEDRGIYSQSKPLLQFSKFLEEGAETSAEIAHGNVPGVIDGIGDCVVCLVHVAKLEGVELEVLEWSHDDAEQNTEVVFMDIINAASKWAYSEAIWHLGHLATCYGTTLEHCIDTVIPIINGRKGQMINGKWVKQS